jgi:hypothetical protein
MALGGTLTIFQRNKFNSKHQNPGEPPCPNCW